MEEDIKKPETLKDIFTMQLDLMDKIKEDKPDFWSNEKYEGERINRLCSFLIHEAVELQQETKWKWWKASENYEVDYENRKVEIADLWHVLIQLTMECGMDAEDIIEAYEKKWRANLKRQEDRY